MTCVMGEGEDSVPDTVAHVHVEHPESKTCKHWHWAPWKWKVHTLRKITLKVKVKLVHIYVESTLKPPNWNWSEWMWRPAHTLMTPRQFWTPNFQFSLFGRIEGKVIVLCAHDATSKWPAKSLLRQVRRAQKKDTLANISLCLSSQSAPFTKILVTKFDLYWEGTKEKLIIWTGGQRRLSYR